MYLVAIHNWQKDGTSAAKAIADILGILVFEARQKITGGDPAMLTSFAALDQAQTLARKLSRSGVPAMVIDTQVVRATQQHLKVKRFVLGARSLQIETADGKTCTLDYAAIDQLLVATCTSGPGQTIDTVTERKFSLGKTLLAGGVPLTKKVVHKEIHGQEERDETLWLYASGPKNLIFDRAALNYEGLGDEIQVARALNFTYLKTALRRLAPQACYDDRLLKRASLVRILGPSLNPETDLDLAFEILSRSLKGQG